MSGRVEIISIFEDNYVFSIFENETSDQVILVDPGEAFSCLKYLELQKLCLKAILVTHHHLDHIGGVEELRNSDKDIKVYASINNREQIHFADHYLQDHDLIKIQNLSFQVFCLPGHTLGHVAYYERNNKWLFSGDVLFGSGSGRLFEGTPEMMFSSLQNIKSLPNETLIFCTHEYTLRNIEFTELLIKTNQIPLIFDFSFYQNYKKEMIELRNQNKPTVPLKLKNELKINPFLLETDLKRWTYLRQLRNRL